MQKLVWIKFLSIMITLGCVQAQTAIPGTSNDAGTQNQKTSAGVDELSPPHKPGEKVGIVRGVLKRFDPIYDQLIIQTFGGRDLHISFDGQTKLLANNANANLASIPAGSVISVDTVIGDNGKLLARSVRTTTADWAELNGQVVRYDPTRSQLIVRDPISPKSVSLHVDSNTKVVNGSKTASPQALSTGMLVKVWFSQNAANRIEIVAEPGSSYTFEGRIIAVDLHSRILSLTNNTDQSLRELTFASLDGSSLALLREGAEVSIQAEFDGDHYNVRAVTPVRNNP
jgi:hypothetical protein